MNAYRDSVAIGPVIDALADDTRRRVFELLTVRPMAVGELAARMPVSRPAVSQHLKVLKDAGLVQERKEGTRRVYSFDPAGAEPLRDYLERLWGDALARFEQAARKAPRKPERSRR